MIKQILINHKDKFILFVFPFILISINSNWIFTPVTNYLPDPWFYLAYFRYFYTYAPAFPSNTHYFVERLTWNVPGYYIYKIFPPLQANYILHLTVYYVAIFSLYGILHLIFNHRTALMSALLMGSYPWFLRAAGWDYTDGTGIAHMLLLIFLITLAHYSDHWRLCFLLGGIVHSSLLITNLFWVGFFPSWVLYFLILNIQTKKFKSSQLILAISYFLIGNLFTVGIAGLFYYWVTGNYFFIENSLKFAVFLSYDAASKSGTIINYGHLRPYWHVIPVVIACVSTWKLWASKRDKSYHSFVATYLLFILAYGWLIFWHSYSMPFLIVFPYSSFAIPAVFLLLGALLSHFFDGFSNRLFEVFTIISAALLTLPLILLRILPSIENLQGNIYLVLCFSLILLSILLFPKRRMSILTTALILSILFYVVGEKSFVYLSNPLKGRDNFMAIISASQVLDSYYLNHKYKDFRLWFRSDENYDTFFSLAGLYLYPWGSALGHPYSSKEPPIELSIESHEILEEGDNIVIISSNPKPDEILIESNRSISHRNAILNLETSKTIQQGSLRFFLYFTKVDILP